MRLGDFLLPATARQAPTKQVKFRVIGISNSDGSQLSADAEATMIFVSETERQLANRDARKFLRETYGDGSYSDAVLDEEITYQVLFRALRDTSNLLVSFAETVKGLRNSLVWREANELWNVYHEFVREEFPASVSKEEFEGLIKAAETSFLPALLKGFGFSAILRALPGLADHYGK